jgi:hypothetical protein
MTTEQRVKQIENERSHQVMSKEEFVSFMENLRNGSHTYGSMVSNTMVKMNKTGNPFYGRVTKLSKWGFGCNTSYKKKGDNLREQEGIEEEFNPNSSYVQSTNDKENYVVCCKKDNPQIKYLRVYTNPNSNESTFTEYYIDGVKATDFEMEQLKTFLKKSTKGSHNLGIKGDEAFGTFNVGVDSVKFIYIDGKKIKVV